MAFRKMAFTLAEVLITLGVIGVVAALTLPSLIQKSTEKETVVALKKFYSESSQAFSLAVEKDGEPDQWSTIEIGDGEGSDEFIAHMKPYFKILKDCSYDQAGCSSEGKYKTLAGMERVTFADGSSRHSKFVLSNGMLVTFFLNSKECKFKSEEMGDTPQLKNICGGLAVDINGHKKPNVYGRDYFIFYVTKYGIIPSGSPSENKETSNYPFSVQCKRTNTSSYFSGHGCAAWVIYNENMDYLHCDDLSWEGKHKCK